MQIMLTGGTGLLGQELLKLDGSLIAPSRQELDVADRSSVFAGISGVSPDIVIHAAAVTNNRLIDRDPTSAIEVNIQGTANVALVCHQENIRLVYLSTDYVYPGTRGNYSERDELRPFNKYAWSKLAGEASVRCVPNHLIIRTSFGASEFPYPRAFIDKWASKMYVDEVAPLILEAATGPLTGVLNLGRERETLYTFARRRNPEVLRLTRTEAAEETPRDTSLNVDKWHAFQDGRALTRAVAKCRCCGSASLSKYLDLGMMPLANNLRETALDARRMERIPLQVCFCRECAMSQLSTVVDPERLFSHYTYRSSVSQSFIQHCREMATTIGRSMSLGSDDLVVDIAGNDGALLNAFREVLGVRVLNVDPAGNIAAVASSRGIATKNEFWSTAVANEIVEEFGRPRLITATNVFAHVDNVREFLQAVKRCLHQDGLLMLEFPYLVDFIEKSEFDTVYFEHLSYLAIKPVERLASSLGMSLINVEKQDIHGGTVRVFISPDSEKEAMSSVGEFLASERKGGYYDFEKYDLWANQINCLIRDLAASLWDLKQRGARIAAFGASAKGNTLLNSCRLDRNVIDYIVDDTPEKIGMYSPGTGIPIVHRSQLFSDQPDYLLILAWNFKDEIIENTADYGRRGGKYLIPIPQFETIEVAS